MKVFRNGVRHPQSLKKEAIVLRKSGLTHREISKELKVSSSIVHLWTTEIVLSQAQKEAIQKRRGRHVFTNSERKIMTQRLKPFQYKIKFSDEDLLKKIQHFYYSTGRIPLKREFNDLKIYRDRFGSWNKAVQLAGFEVNPILFSKKIIAKDGHICDSFSEKIIDDWFNERSISHHRSTKYQGTKFTADFFLEPNIFIEFFGLAGVQKKYDDIIRRKRDFCKENKIQLIEIYPSDIVPKNNLAKLFSF